MGILINRPVCALKTILSLWMRVQKISSLSLRSALREGAAAWLLLPETRHRGRRSCPSVAAGGLPPQLPVEGENSSSPHAARARTSDSLSLRHRPEACCAAGRLAHFTAASTFAGFDHRVLLCSTCTVLADPSAMMYAKAFKWVLEDRPYVGCEFRSLSGSQSY